jgi:hypothetical protein
VNFRTAGHDKVDKQVVIKKSVAKMSTTRKATAAQLASMQAACSSCEMNLRAIKNAMMFVNKIIETVS